MGLDVTNAKQLLSEIKRNQDVLSRNCVVLPKDFVLRNEYSLIKDELCYTNGMVRFEYKDWSGPKRRIEGHVCSVEKVDALGSNVKIWTEKNEMISVYFCFNFELNVIQLPSDYTALRDNHEF